MLQVLGGRARPRPVGLGHAHLREHACADSIQAPSPRDLHRAAAAVFPAPSPLGLSKALPDPKPRSVCFAREPDAVRRPYRRPISVSTLSSTLRDLPARVRGAADVAAGTGITAGSPPGPRRGPWVGEDRAAAGGTVSPSLRPPAASAAALAPGAGARPLAASSGRGPASGDPPARSSRRPPPAASPWRPTANGKCVFLLHIVTLAKLPETFSTKDLVLAW